MPRDLNHEAISAAIADLEAAILATNISEVSFRSKAELLERVNNLRSAIYPPPGAEPSAPTMAKVTITQQVPEPNLANETKEALDEINARITTYRAHLRALQDKLVPVVAALQEADVALEDSQNNMHDAKEALNSF
jgi:hypothetical protein